MKFYEPELASEREGFVGELFRYLTTALDLTALSFQSLRIAAKESRALLHAGVFIVMGGLAQAVGAFDRLALLTYPICSVFFMSLGAYVLTLVVRKLSSHPPTLYELAILVGFISILNWTALALYLPVVGKTLFATAKIWMTVVMIVSLRELAAISLKSSIGLAVAWWPLIEIPNYLTSRWITEWLRF